MGMVLIAPGTNTRTDSNLTPHNHEQTLHVSFAPFSVFTLGVGFSKFTEPHLTTTGKCAVAPLCSTITAPTCQGMDSTRPLKGPCGIRHQDVRSRSFKSSKLQGGPTIDHYRLGPADSQTPCCQFKGCPSSDYCLKALPFWRC